MKMARKIIILTFMFFSINAGAVTIHPGSIGTLGPAIGASNPDILIFDQKFDPGVVDDIFLFDINTAGLPSAAAASITSISMDSVSSSFGPVKILDIPDFEFALTDSLGRLLTAFVKTGESVEIDPISTGTFGIWLRGNATGLAGGQVAGPIALSSVPIPAAVWLFGSALVGLAGFRRKLG